ncbi:hypothetical protein CO540_00105 [Micromonospora sp. WMMA2032]|uniref:hypothetical protein n=1 Tax=Micromonospora sp. WMMA2032 TaxID=2039870 RepID=UPI000C0597D4|nr:hypothetical protein [Micromonospora sp. WMMA2032]ATO12438.1 hypothetical protein CO540_00105 [Micromonospora sp. WMMA2032]
MAGKTRRLGALALGVTVAAGLAVAGVTSAYAGQQPALPPTAAAVAAVTVAKTPGLPAGDKSSIYAVSVEGKTPSVYRTAPKARTCSSTNCDGGDYARADNRSFNWSSFWFPVGTTPTVTVTRTAAAGAVTDIKVRGTGDYTIVSKDLAARQIKIRVNRPKAKLSVEFIDNRYDSLRQLPLDGMLLFADDSRAAVADPSRTAPDTYVVNPGATFDRSRAARSTTVIFTRGVHDLGYWPVPDSVQRVHLAGGAYVKGAIDSATVSKSTQQGFTVTGRGVLSGEDFDWRADKRTNGTTSCSYDCWEYTVKMVQLGTDKFRFHDVTVVNAPHWVVTGHRDNEITAKQGDDESRFTGTISDVKVLGNWGWNGDGIPALTGTTISDSFVSAFDDAFKLYSSNATIKNNTLWQMDNGAVFQLGWFAKTISNITATNNTLLHTEWTGTNSNWGLLNYQEAGGSGAISNVSVTGTRIMGPTTRVVALSNTSASQAFRDITLADTRVDRLYSLAEINSLRGNGSKDLPRNLVKQAKAPLELTITNLTIGGTRITSANARTDGGFDITGSPTLAFN